MVRAYDPAAGEAAGELRPGPRGGRRSVRGVRRRAASLALLTEWDEFRWLDFDRVAESMAPPRALVDARNLLDPAAMRRRGFAYQGVGR